ncbi:MAG: Gfo/Idh/MocA family oxidoreductase [Terriglobales bacterium]
MVDTFASRAPSPSDRALSVGIVGAGEIVSRIHLPVLSACEGIQLAYVADKNPESARLVAKSFGCQPISLAGRLEELPETDVVLLAVPVSARGPYHELFAGRGTQVLSEKPLATSLSDAERACVMYPEHALACGFQRRAYATTNLARLLVSQNWFGPLRSVSLSEGALTTKTGADSRFYDQAGSGGGVLMDLGCHSLDLAIYISGATEVAVAEQRFVFDEGVDREVEACMLLRTPSGTCELDYFVTWLRPAENVIHLRFDNCVVSFSCRPAQHIEIRGIRSEQDAALLSAKQAGATTVYQAFYLEWMDFLAGVRNRQPSRFSARSALATVRAVEMLYTEGKRAAGKRSI